MTFFMMKNILMLMSSWKHLSNYLIMKNIVLPITTDTSVDLVNINENTKGLIIVYNDKDLIGYINYGDQTWFFCDSIDSTSYYYSEYNLIDLINKLLTNSESIRFKLLEFECETSY